MQRAVALLLLAVACGGDDDPPERPTRLSKAGLYRDFARREIDPSFTMFTPSYTLWSDGTTKRRFMRLPRGGSIDKSDPDHWRFPVGTQFFKEFSKDGVLLETRLVERTGPGDDDYWMGSFVWSDDGSDAVYAPDGATNVRGTDHDVPGTERCHTCHNGEPGRYLGFSAVQQAASAPGSDQVAAALGYLHANCGHCHNPNGIARPDSDMDLRLRVGDAVPELTTAYTTTIGVATQYYRDPLRPMRVVAGDPDGSALFYRMALRGGTTQMPPIATKHVDDVGVAVIRGWIEKLQP